MSTMKAKEDLDLKRLEQLHMAEGLRRMRKVQGAGY